ncbi:hypothetical protein PFY10_07210 [Chryseobacterium daecheongense]|nr:hypothetical protein PFY10_07210 [Chryseobacterium daecheongense]
MNYKAKILGHPFRSGTCISRGVDDISRSVSGVGYYTWRTGGKNTDA